MSAVLLRQYVQALIAPITTAFSNALENIQAQINGIQAGTGTGGPYLPLIGGEISGSLKVDGQMQVPTATIGDNSLNAASTAFVVEAIAASGTGNGSGSGTSLSITYSDYVDNTGSRSFNTIYTNSFSVPLKLLITINEAYALSANDGPQFSLYVNGIEVSYFASTNDTVFVLYAEVNPGKTYEIQTQPGNLAYVEYWFEKKDAIISISGG